MYISQKELEKNNINLDLQTLENNLVQLGHEVEAVETYGNEKVVVGKVLTCEKHPEADRLNVTTVDVNADEPLQIVCGAPNVAAGQLVPVALVGAKFGDFKIKKAKLRGVVSQGMICSLAELGLSDSVITEADKAGIYVFDQANVGENAFSALELEDNILELGLTANRGDCQSYIGVKRDLLALLGEKQPIEVNRINGDFDSEFTVTNSDENTKQLSFVEVQNVNYTESPIWLKMFLAKHHIKSQNAIVDLTNYVMLQTGIPMHAYDAAKIKGGLEVTKITETIKYTALDENEYELKAGDLVIKDQEKIVSIAAVMGSNETKITENTTNIIVEIGNFDKTAVRLSANSLGNKTDASSRGEKGIDAMQIENAFSLFVTELLKINDARVSNVKSSEIRSENQQEITLKYSEIKVVLGIDVSIDQTKTILNNLHFEVVAETNDSITVSVPTWRFDMENDHDLVEEIIRIIGMEAVEVSDVLSTIITKNRIINDPKIQIEREIEQIMLQTGLNQTITYSLVNSDDLSTFNQESEYAVELMMPLSKEHAVYRQSLIPSLMEVAKYNFDRQQKTINIFEIANTYKKIDGDLQEEYLLSAVFAGQKETYYANEKTNYDFYDAKGALVTLLDHYNLNYEIVVTENQINEINQYAHADVLIDGEYVGFIGKTHPNYYKKLKSDVFVFEINLKKIEAKLNKKITYKPVSTQPEMERDLTIITTRNEEYKAIIEVFSDVKHLKSIGLKDIYTGEKIDSELKATTFTLIFADDTETLTGELIDEQIEKIFTASEEKKYLIKR